MNHSRKMVLISEDKYAQLQTMTKPTKNDTQPSQVEENDTQTGQVVEKVTKPNAVTDKMTQTETMMNHFPIQSQCNLQKGTEKITTRKKITKTDPSSEKLTGNGSNKISITKSRLGEERPRPRGPPGVPFRKQQKQLTDGLPPGWVNF